MIEVDGTMYEKVGVEPERERWMKISQDGSILAEIDNLDQQKMLDEIQLLTLELAECSRLRTKWLQAFGMVSTVKEDMVVDVEDPDRMAEQIIAHVDELAKKNAIMEMRLVNVFQDQKWVKENV